MKILAHRGFSAQAPENTLAAFDAAVTAGADGIELDVTLSADGVPVVIHDDTLERTTTGSGRVTDHSLDDLRRLDAGSWFDSKFGSETIPTLEAALDVTRTLSVVNVELKGGSAAPAGLVDAVLAVLKDPERILVSSFDPRLLWKLRRRDPRYRTALLFGQKGAVSAMWRIWSRIIGAQMLHPQHHLVEKVVSVTRQPQRVNTWTVNDVDRIVELDALHIHGVITDNPVAARKALASMV